MGTIVAMFVSAFITFCVYLVIRSVAVDDGGVLDHAAALVVALLITTSFFKVIGRK